MPNAVLFGTQWGDEGKGKLVDLLCESADMVVRFQGGNNAGHTLKVEDRKLILHLIPSGILRPDVTCVIAAGVVVDPFVLAEEIRKLAEAGVDMSPQRLKLCLRAHLIMPYHKSIDAWREGVRAEDKIGTTGRGIGPAYEDRAGRIGIHAGALADVEHLKACLAWAYKMKKPLLDAAGAPSEEDVYAQLLAIRDKLIPYLDDTQMTITDAIGARKKVMFEGAQGALLDIDSGTYPYVTSSNTYAGAAATGSGISPRWIQEIIGVLKAYTTRVGGGPFPTEADDAAGAALRERGAEFGSTTGRPRRCGWLDLPALRRVVKANGVTMLALTKLDVLTGCETIPVCVAYDIDGKRYDVAPSDPTLTHRAKPIYEELKGWTEPLDEIRKFGDLPAAARDYVRRIENELGVPYVAISVGPARHQSFLLRDPFLGSINLK